MGLIPQEIKAVLKKKDLIKYLVLSDLKTNYKGKALGFLWMLLDPLFMMLVYVILVVFIFKRGGAQFPILLFSALISWRWFVQSTSNSLKTFKSNGNLIKSINVPLHVFPINTNTLGFTAFIASFTVLIPMLFIFDATINLNILWFPILVAIQLLFTIGFSFIFAVAGVYFSDLHNIMAFTFKLWFYFSPALYDLSAIPIKFRTIYLVINPFASLFESYKNVLVHGTPPNKFIILFLIEAIALTYIGPKWITKSRPYIVKKV